MFSKHSKSSKLPKPIAALLAAIEAAGDDVQVVGVSVPASDSPFERYVDGVRIISPRTFAEIQRRDEFTKDERELVELMFHQSGLEQFTNLMIGFCLQVDEVHRSRLRAAFPQEFKVVDIALDKAKMDSLLDRVLGLDRFLRTTVTPPSRGN